MKKPLKWSIAQKAERIWWKNYLKGKSPEEYLQWKRTYWTNFLKEINANQFVSDSKTILDAGCGPAGIFTIFDDKEVTAVDPLLDAYEQDLVHFSTKDYPYTTFVCSGLEQIELKEKFDLIFCLNAINHVADMNISMEKLYHSLKPNGVLVISTDAHRSNFLKKIFQWLPGDILHPHQFNAEEYKNVFAAPGFEFITQQIVKKEPIFDYIVYTFKKK